MSSPFSLYVILVFAGLFLLTVGYVARRLKTGLGLMVAGIVTLLGVVVYYITTVLS